jgi:hypothetical protein
VFFAIAQSFGALGPYIFGSIISRAVDTETHKVISVTPLAIAYVGSAVVMFGGGLVAWFLGVDAEGKSLEEIAPGIDGDESPHSVKDDAS